MNTTKVESLGEEVDAGGCSVTVREGGGTGAVPDGSVAPRRINPCVVLVCSAVHVCMGMWVEKEKDR